MENTAENNSKVILKVLLGFSLALIVGGIIGAIYEGNLGGLIPGFITINTRPSQFTMDYFVLGGLGATFLNCGMVGLACVAVLFLSKANCTGVTVAAYWLNVGFSPFGMTFVTFWPFALGVWVYSRIKKVKFGSVANFVMFSTALAPFAGELLFRYPALETKGFTIGGLVGALILGIVVGCVMPALCAHAQNFHKGYDLYNAGPAAGFLAFFMYCLLFKSPGVEVPTNTNLGDGHRGFVTVFFIIVFVACLVVAYMMDKNCFQEYKKLWKSDGYKMDYTSAFGMPATMVNFGVYGLFILLYYSVVMGMTIDGGIAFTPAKFTGATFGAVMCMYCFVAAGAQPRTVFPIIVGYAIASFWPMLMFATGIAPTQNWTLVTQGILVGTAFASGLAPISGKWGFWPGVIAGAMHAILVTSVSLWHGGFCLYNGGFTDGVVAFLLIPILESYFVSKAEKNA